MPDISISENEVKTLLTNINPHKPIGPHEIPARLIKETAEELAAVFTTLFGASLKREKLPHDWKTTNVTPAFNSANLYNTVIRPSFRQ